MKKRNTLGFTIVELIVSIAVIGILAGIVIVSYTGWRKSTIVTQVKSDLNGAASAMESARTFNNTYPTSISGLTTFKPSQGVILSGGSSDGGITYCIDASSSQDATIHYYIDSISGGAGAQSGTCATRLVPVLIATATSGSTIDLSWTAVSGATGYTLQIASSSTFADASTIATQSGLTFTSTGLLASTTYYYRVGVTNSPGLWSITKSATTTITAPITPTVIANTAGATTTWQWSAADCAAGTTGRYQYRYTISSGYDSGLVATNNTSIGFTTSAQGNTYTVAVQAQCYNSNASSAWSSAGSASYTHIATAIPTNLTATTASSSSINVSWSASTGATSYTLQRGSNSSFTDATTITTQTGLTFVSSGLSIGTPYYYRVQATDINGVSNWSTTATATTLIDTPATPVVSTNTISDTTTWSWNVASCSSGASARYQYRYTTSYGYDSGLIPNASTSVSFTTSAQSYTYTVQVQAQCYNANTSSAWSGMGSASYYSPVGGRTVFTASGTFTVPTGVNLVYLTGVGPGGDGGIGANSSSSNQAGGSGGGSAGQELVRYPVVVTPGNVITVSIIPGGTVFGSYITLLKGATGGTGANGGAAGAGGSMVGSYAAGGNGGTATTGSWTGGGGGAGGVPTFGITGGIAGGSGWISSPAGGIFGAGSGGAGHNGAGSPGTNATCYGCGGGGAAGNAAGSYAQPAGGAGTSGLLIVEW